MRVMLRKHMLELSFNNRAYEQRWKLSRLLFTQQTRREIGVIKVSVCVCVCCFENCLYKTCGALKRLYVLVANVFLNKF